MNPQYLPFVFSAALGLVAWGAVTRRYIWPALRGRSLSAAAEPLLYLHLFRYVGLAFLVPGVVGAGLRPEWAYPAALGDVGAAALAGLCLILSRGPAYRVGLWVFNVWGTLDLLRAAVLGPVYEVVPWLQATYFIPAVGVPLLLWTHVVIFALLLRRSDGPAPDAEPGAAADRGTTADRHDTRDVRD